MRLIETATRAQVVIAEAKQAIAAQIGTNVGLDLRVVNDDLVEIEHVHTHWAARRQGLATKAMELLIAIAGKHHVKLRLYVDPDAGADSNSPDADQLTDWYHELGFSWSDNEDGMTLEP